MLKTGSARSIFTWLLLLLFLVMSLISFNPRAAEAEEGQATAEYAAGDSLQFTSGGHVIDFRSGEVLVASADHMLKTKFIKANPVSPQSGEEGKEGSFSRVNYTGLWKGVDLVYTTEQGAILESSYYIAPSNIDNSVDQIRLKYSRPVSLDDTGNLVMAFDTGNLTESRPLAWQEINGQQKPVEVGFRLYSENEVGFAIKDYQPGIALVIDPSLSWNTFLGSSSTDQAKAIAVDSSGNVYVTGYSFATWGSPLLPYSSGRDIFVVKLNSSGALTWLTFLGGSGADAGYGIAVDSSGNVYVTGGTSATWGSPKRAYSNSGDAYAAKLNTDGGLTWNTFLGSANWDNGKGIAVDSSGNVYVVGDSEGTWGTPIRSLYSSGNKDAFVACLDSTGVLTWNTFLGNSGTDDGMAIALSGTDIYVSGYCDATWQGTSAPVRAYLGGNDAFAAKLDSDGGLTWNTFLGSAGTDYGYGIAADSSGNAYVSGYSSATWGSPVRDFTSGNDAFAAKLSSSGVLSWNTFLGGSGTDQSWAIAADSSNVYLCGYSSATWGSPVRDYTSGNDAFAAKLDASTGGLTWDAFLGGDSTDEGWAIAADSSNVYVAGYSTATWDSPVRGYTSGEDGFVAKVDDSTTTSSGVGGNFSPVNRLVLVVPLLILVIWLVAGGSYLLLRCRKAN